ncbi:solute carrier family 22 member 7-like [Ornithodoros turicata]|uniref:solute carrier family 22 member 7-like n=1 Tax=Ornithodoros turicata TaxID=34597 RepID=UPI003138B6E1
MSSTQRQRPTRSRESLMPSPDSLLRPTKSQRTTRGRTPKTKRVSSDSSSRVEVSSRGSSRDMSSQAPSANPTPQLSEPFQSKRRKMHRSRRRTPPSLPPVIEAHALEGPLRLPMPQPSEGASRASSAPSTTGQLSANPQLEASSECTDITQADIYGHGYYQSTILFCCVLSLVVFRCHSLAFKIIARHVDFWCRKPAVFQNFTDAEWKNVGIPIMQDGTFSRCKVYDDPLGPYRNQVPCAAWEYDRSPRTIITTWNLVCNKEWVLSFAAVMYIIGAVVFLPAMGMIADQVGRRPVTCIAVAVLLAAGVWTCFASNLTFFVCARCAVSGCTSTIFVTIFTLLFEVTSVEYRTLYCIVAISLGVVISSIIISVLSQFEIDWRITQVMLMGLTSLLLSTFYIVEESPCWLLACCNFKRAEEAMLWAAQMNGESLENVRMKFNKLKSTMPLKAAARGVTPLGVTPFFLFICPVIRVRCGNILIFWFIVMLTFYGYETSNVIEHELMWTKVITLLCPGPLSVVSYYAIRRIGRKTTLILSLGFVGMASAALILTYPRQMWHIANLFLVIARGATYVAVSVSFIYTAELFPTVLRSIGICTAYLCGQLGAVAAVVLRSAQNLIPGPIGMTVLAAAVLFAEFALLRLPETSSQPLIHTLKQLEELNLKVPQPETFPEGVGRAPPKEPHGLANDNGPGGAQTAFYAERLKSQYRSLSSVQSGGRPKSRGASTPPLSNRKAIST